MTAYSANAISAYLQNASTAEADFRRGRAQATCATPPPERKLPTHCT